MSFHIGQHKPRKKPLNGNQLRLRLQLIGVAAICLYLGLVHSPYRIGYVNWYAMPIYYLALDQLAVLLVLFALIPFSWLEKPARWLLSDRKGKRSSPRIKPKPQSGIS
jgi:hypothetical protein